jgi:transposase
MVPWAAHDAWFTRDFEEMTAYLAQQMDKTAVCTLMGINWRTVGAVIGRVVSERLDPKRLDNLSMIGVDEVSYRKQHNYLTVVIDHVKRKTVWAAEGKGGATLGAFFDELGEERVKTLTTATMDMSQAYISKVKERAPDAQIIFDRFHVQKLAGEAVDEVRRNEYRLCADDPEMADFIKGSRWAVLKNWWNLTPKQGQKLREIQTGNKRLYRAYLLKETLGRALDYLQPARARKLLDEWLWWASHSRLAPFVKLSKTIRRHKEGILAYIKSRLTNGLVEGLNNKVRLITRRAYGFHSAQALISMVYLCCGGITLYPPLPQPTVRT